MALKLKITKEAYDKLSDSLKGEYVEKDGEFVLDVDGMEDTGALKRAKDRESQLRKDAEKDAKELREQLDALSTGDARKRGDIETLEKSWKEKYDNGIKEVSDKLSKIQQSTSKSLVESTASAIASKISTVPALMSKVIKDRLTVDFEGDAPTLKVLDSQGKPSALTLDELSAEFVANKEFSDIIVGSKASGGGAAKDGFNKSGGAANNDPNKTVLFSKMSAADLAANIKTKVEANKE